MVTRGINLISKSLKRGSAVWSQKSQCKKVVWVGLRAPPKLFKGVAEGIAPSLNRLYDNCINLGEWPSEWKKGEWTPVFKKGDR